MRKCEVKECGRRHHAKGKCMNHYMRTYNAAGGDRVVDFLQRRGPKVSAAPLKELLQRYLDIGVTYQGIAVMVGLTVKDIERVMRRPLLNIYQADAICIALGMHPIELWPDWGLDVSELDEVAA